MAKAVSKLGARKSGNRCPDCRMLPDLCLCQEMPSIELEHCELALVIHYREMRHTTNSGQLGANVFSPSKILEWGHMGERGEKQRELFLSKVYEQDCENWILFPHETSSPLTNEFMQLHPNAKSKKRRLWVPDGNWKQAKRIANRLIQHMPDAVVVTLPFEKLSTYQLRRESHPDKMSTYEAIVRALCVLENTKDFQAKALSVFDKMVNRAMYSRGQAKLLC